MQNIAAFIKENCPLLLMKGALSYLNHVSVFGGAHNMPLSRITIDDDTHTRIIYSAFSHKILKPRCCLLFLARLQDPGRHPWFSQLSVCGA